MSETHPAQAGVASGDPDEVFRRLVDPHRRELLVHCYRILGSLEDAEDMFQETLLRAWRGLDSYGRRGSLRAWLYKIATNASLDALEQRRRRALPTTTHRPANPAEPLPEPVAEALWLEPMPDALFDGLADNPEARYLLRESVSLAFLAALQRLPARQRAVLILRDVLGWKAAEVATLLDMTVAAANSALQRARTTMHRAYTAGGTMPPAADEQTAALVARYMEAWEAGDSTALVELLREEAIMTMPPLPAWYRGRADIRQFLDTYLFLGDMRGRFRLLVTRANGCPAVAVYQRDEGREYRPAALHVLVIRDRQIAEVHDFLAFDQRLFSRFGLPPSA